MMPGVHIKELDAFGRGFFQDILTLMQTLDIEELTKEDVTRYRDNLFKYNRKGNKTHKRKPCKGCKDKK